MFAGYDFLNRIGVNRIPLTIGTLPHSVNPNEHFQPSYLAKLLTRSLHNIKGLTDTRHPPG